MMAETEEVADYTYIGCPGIGTVFAKAASRHHSSSPWNIVEVGQVNKGSYPSSRATLIHAGGFGYSPNKKAVGIEGTLYSATSSLALRNFVENNLAVGEVNDFSMDYVFGVVDGEQGGRERLEKAGITTDFIFTATELLGLGLAQRYLTQTQHDHFIEYIRDNPLWPIDEDVTQLALPTEMD